MFARIRFFVRRTVGALCTVIEPAFGSYEEFLIDEKYLREYSQHLACMEAVRKGDVIRFRRIKATVQKETV